MPVKWFAIYLWVNKMRDYIPFIKRNDICKIFIEDIMMIEQDLRKIVIHTEEEQHQCYGKISELSEYLDGRFYKCHCSCIINMDKVVRMKDRMIYFENGFVMPICREKFQNAKQYFAIYIKKRMQRMEDTINV